MKKSLAQVRDENEGAFTLVELLVVILIIGILAAIAIPAFLNQRKAAVDASVESDIKNASTQVETWMVSNPSTDVPAFQIGTGEMSTDFDAVSYGPIEDIKVSDGTGLVVAPGAERGTYTITGTNEGGNDAADGMTFNSADGGFDA